MKFEIVTFVRAYNYGAVLQAYALYKEILSLGNECEVLDYLPDYFKKQYQLSNVKGLRYFPYRPLSVWKKHVPMLYALRKRTKKFDNFVEHKISLSNQQYTSIHDIDKNQPKTDAYIVGSDQVWNSTLTHDDEVFYLNFVSSQTCKKTSYAASFGGFEVEKEKIDIFKKRFDDWDALSVREESASRILYQITQKESCICIDPTFFLKKDEWIKISKTRIPYKHFILLYYQIDFPGLAVIAKRLSVEKKMPVICLTGNVNYNILTGKNEKEFGFICANTNSPEEFIGLIDRADYVITDSFHGTAFSIIFHKQFLVLVDGWVYNSRADSLLKEMGLIERKIIGNDLAIDNHIDWDTVDKKIERAVAKSEAYLRNIMVKCER